MIDKEIAHMRVEEAHAFGRWFSRAADDLRHAFRVLERIQYRRPWDDAACGDGVGSAGPGTGR